MTSRPSTAAPILAVLAVVLGLLTSYLGMLDPRVDLSISLTLQVLNRDPA